MRPAALRSRPAPARASIGSRRCWSRKTSRSRRARSSRPPRAKGREPQARAASSSSVPAGVGDRHPSRAGRRRAVGARGLVHRLRRRVQPDRDRVLGGEDAPGGQSFQRARGRARGELVQGAAATALSAMPAHEAAVRSASRANQGCAAIAPGPPNSSSTGRSSNTTRCDTEARRPWERYQVGSITTRSVSVRSTQADSGGPPSPAPAASTSARCSPPAPEQKVLTPRRTRPCGRVDHRRRARPRPGPGHRPRRRPRSSPVAKRPARARAAPADPWTARRSIALRCPS